MRTLLATLTLLGLTLSAPVASGATEIWTKGRTKQARLDLYVVYGPVLVRGVVREYPQADALVQIYAHNKLIRTAHTNAHGRVRFPVPASTRLLLRVTANPGGVRHTGSNTLPPIPPGGKLEWTSRFCANIC